MKAEAWAAEMEATGIIQAEIAQREGYTRARVCQIMKLVGLDEEIKAAILARDKSASGLSAKAAIAMVK